MWRKGSVSSGQKGDFGSRRRKSASQQNNIIMGKQEAMFICESQIVLNNLEQLSI